MKNAIFSDSATIAYAAWIVRWRWVVIALTVAITLAAASGGRFLTLSTDYRDFFGEARQNMQDILRTLENSES